MQIQFTKIAVMMLAGLAIFLTGCSQPQPIFIVITAVPPPTLTPLPALPVATITPQSLAPVPPTNTPVPPPQPAGPTATPVLIQLGVFDQGGGQMDLTMFGPSVATKFMVFRAVVCNPDCKNRPDGRDVDNVKFTFYRWNQNTGQKGAKLFEQTEGAVPYCSFGGSDKCDFLDLSDRNVKWPGTNTVIDNGEYFFEVTAQGKGNRNWNGNFRFRVQR